MAKRWPVTCDAETGGYDGMFGTYYTLPPDHDGRHFDGSVEWWDTTDGPPRATVQEAKELLRAERGHRLWVVFKEVEGRPRISGIFVDTGNAMAEASKIQLEAPEVRMWIEDHVLR